MTTAIGAALTPQEQRIRQAVLAVLSTRHELLAIHRALVTKIADIVDLERIDITEHLPSDTTSFFEIDIIMKRGENLRVCVLRTIRRDAWV